MSTFIRQLFLARKKRKVNLDLQKTPEHYLDLVQETMERCGISWDSLIVEIQPVGAAVKRKQVYAAMVYLSRWERNTAIRLLMGLPLIEAKIREAAQTSWLSGHSHFIGLWVHASARLQFPDELRHLIQELTKSSSNGYSTLNPQPAKETTMPPIEVTSLYEKAINDPGIHMHKAHWKREGITNIIKTIFSLASSSNQTKKDSGQLTPYTQKDANKLYAGLFFDDINGFESLRELLPNDSAHTEFDTSVIESHAQDTANDACTRFHLFRILRARGLKVPYKLLMGVVVETHLHLGLDTIAVYTDGQIHRIRHDGMSISITKANELDSVAADICSEAQRLVYEMLPHNRTTLNPPPVDILRISMLTSQGMYVTEASNRDMSSQNSYSKLIKVSQRLATGLDCYCE